MSIASDTYTMSKLTIDHLQATIDSLRDENAKLRAENASLVKLLGAAAERMTELEQKAGLTP